MNHNDPYFQVAVAMLAELHKSVPKNQPESAAPKPSKAHGLPGRIMAALTRRSEAPVGVQFTEELQADCH
jgi:hypothetical protein